MVIENCHGQYVVYEFATRHFQEIKTGDEMFKLVLVP
jgi:hypothetical protein